MATEHKRTVALAVDESEHSDRAFQWYCDHILKDGDHVILIHVPESYDFTMASEYETINFTSASPTALDQSLRELQERVKNLEKKYEDKLKSLKLTGKFRTGHGKPGEVIINISKEEEADLIVTGTRGLGKFRRTILGSVSDYIVHHSAVPVLVCRHKPSH